MANVDYRNATLFNTRCSFISKLNFVSFSLSCRFDQFIHRQPLSFSFFLSLLRNPFKMKFSRISSASHRTQNMDNKSTEPSDFSSPLLPTSYGAHDVDVDFLEKGHNGASSVPTTLILTTLVAVFGSYVFGSAVSTVYVSIEILSCYPIKKSLSF